jgi:hypothetical protein
LGNTTWRKKWIKGGGSQGEKFERVFDRPQQSYDDQAGFGDCGQVEGARLSASLP